jgi:hypothetical protein
MRFILLFGTLLLLALAPSCTPAPPVQEEQRVDLIEAERDFDPLAQDQDRPIVITELEEGSEQIRMLQKDQKAPGSQEIPVGPDDAGMIKGYRVQIFLSDNLREAARIMAEARGKFVEEIYLEYDAPYYKVRVGDCQTEAEGQGLLKVAMSLGYRDAWLVYTVITMPDEHSP